MTQVGLSEEQTIVLPEQEARAQSSVGAQG